MSGATEPTLAERVEAAVRAAPGITTVFHSGALPTTIVEAGARALGISDASASLVRIDASNERLLVDVTIGVSGQASVVETVRELHTLVTALVQRETGSVAETRITVAYVRE